MGGFFSSVEETRPAASVFVGSETLAAAVQVDRFPTLLFESDIAPAFRLLGSKRIHTDTVCGLSYVQKKGPRLLDGAGTSECTRAILNRHFVHLDALMRLGPSNVLAAGGSVVDAIRGRAIDADHFCYNNKTQRDVDLFFHGLSISEGEALVKTMVQLLCEQKVGFSHITRNNHSISVVFLDGSVYQFILRMFRDPLQILSSFDIAVCRVGYGIEIGVCATDSCAFGLATGLMVIDCMRFNKVASETRVLKYAARGFDVCFVFGKIKDCHTIGTLNLYWGNESSKNGVESKVFGCLNLYIERGKEEVGDYGRSPFDVGQISLFNLRKARDGDTDFVFVGKSWDELSNPQLPGLDHLNHWFWDCNFKNPNFSYWEDLNEYSLWDIGERLNSDQARRLLDARSTKNASEVQLVLKEAADLLHARLVTALANHPGKRVLFEDVSTGPLITPPWSGWLVKNERDYYNDSFVAPSPPLSDARIEHLLERMRKVHPLWSRLPKDIYHMILALAFVTVTSARVHLRNFCCNSDNFQILVE